MLVDGAFYRHQTDFFESNIEEGTCGGHPVATPPYLLRSLHHTHTATPPYLLPPLTCLTPSPATGTLALIRKKSHYGVTLDVRVRVSEAGHGSLGLGSWLMVQP